MNKALCDFWYVDLQLNTFQLSEKCHRIGINILFNYCATQPKHKPALDGYYMLEEITPFSLHLLLLRHCIKAKILASVRENKARIKKGWSQRVILPGYHQCLHTVGWAWQVKWPAPFSSKFLFTQHGHVSNNISCTPCPKNVTALSHHNSDTHKPILIIYGRNIAQKVS